MPGTEVPAYGLLAGHRRRRPYIFSDAEIEALTAAAATARPRNGLRPTMLATLLGLLASTGLRIGEAIRLTMDDVRLDDRPAHLRVLESKFRKSRLVPVDLTTAAALAGYVWCRHDLGYHALSEIFFVNERDGSFDAGLLGCWLPRQLTGKSGLRPNREGARRASLRPFRHMLRRPSYIELGTRSAWTFKHCCRHWRFTCGDVRAVGHLMVPDRKTGLNVAGDRA